MYNVQCDTCPFRYRMTCKHPKNDYSWVKMGKSWGLRSYKLVKRFYPKPPAWCKAKVSK